MCLSAEQGRTDLDGPAVPGRGQTLQGLMPSGLFCKNNENRLGVGAGVDVVRCAPGEDHLDCSVNVRISFYKDE